MVRLLMSWNIRPGRESDYFQFIVQQFGPGLVKLGIKPTDAWYTAYGAAPQILTGSTAENLDALKRVLASEEWLQLKSELLTFVTDYTQKISRASGWFQL
jgi:hypothetical protein